MRGISIALGLLLASCASAPDPSQNETTETPSRMRVTDRFRVEESVSTIASGAGSIWVAVDDDDILRIDPSTRKVIARISHVAGGQLPGGARQFAFKGSDVWSAVPVGSSPPGGLEPDSPPRMATVYENFRPKEVDLNEIETSGGIVRIDARTNEVRKILLVADYSPESVVATDSGPLIPTKRGMRRLDPDTYRFDDPVGENHGDRELVLSSELGIWAVTSSSIVLLDSDTLTVKLEISRDDVQVSGYVYDIAYDDGVLWVRSELELLKLDASSGDVLARTAVPDLSEIAAGEGFLVVWEPFAGDLHRLDPTTLNTMETLDLRATDVEADGLVIHDHAAWVAHGSAVLRVALS